MRSTFERGPGEEAREQAEALGQARSGWLATGVLLPDIGGLCEERASARSPLRRPEASPHYSRKGE